MLTWYCKSIGAIPCHWATWGKIPVAIVAPHPEGWGVLLLHARESGVTVKMTLEEAQAEVAEWARFNAQPAGVSETPAEKPVRPDKIERHIQVELLDCNSQNIPTVRSMLQIARDKGWVPLFSIGQVVYLERPLENPCAATTPRSSRLSSGRGSRPSSGGRGVPSSRTRCTR